MRKGKKKRIGLTIFLVLGIALCISIVVSNTLIVVKMCIRDSHNSPSRVPMTDWYDTVTSIQAGFQHRTVQGGLFMKVLEASGKCRYWD